MQKTKIFFENYFLLVMFLVGGMLIGLWYVFVRGDSLDFETVVVHRGDIVREVSVSGTVVPAQDVTLGFSASGRTARVFARVGDAVLRGAVLAELENGDFRAAVLQKEAAVEREQAKLAQLEAGKRQEEIAVSEAQVASDRAVLSQARQVLANAIRDGFTRADDAVHNKIDRIFDNPRSGNPQIAFITTESKTETDVEAARPLIETVLAAWEREKDTLSETSAVEFAASAQIRLKDISDLAFAANTALNHAVPSSRATQATLDGWIADVSAARMNINTAVTNLTNAVTSVRNAETFLAKNERALLLDKAGTVKTDIAAQRAAVRSAEADLLNARAQLTKTRIEAPFSGTVTGVALETGEIAQAHVGYVVLQGLATLRIESFIPEINVASVNAGNGAIVTVDAYGAKTFFSARVVSIDPARTIKDGVSTYRALIEFTEKDARIRSGMTANVTITTEKKENVLSVPQGAIEDRDGKKFVRILEKGNETPVERVVATGAVSSVGNVEILSGLADGDAVVLPVK